MTGADSLHHAQHPPSLDSASLITGHLDGGLQGGFLGDTACRPSLCLCALAEGSGFVKGGCFPEANYEIVAHFHGTQKQDGTAFQVLRTDECANFTARKLFTIAHCLVCASAT